MINFLLRKESFRAYLLKKMNYAYVKTALD